MHPQAVEGKLSSNAPGSVGLFFWLERSQTLMNAMAI